MQGRVELAAQFDTNTTVTGGVIIGPATARPVVGRECGAATPVADPRSLCGQPLGDLAPLTPRIFKLEATVLPKVKIVLVQRRGEVEGLYASEPVELLYLDWATDSDAQDSGAVLAKIESAPLADLPDAVADVFCTREEPHPHQGDSCPLDIPEEGEPGDAEPGDAEPDADELAAIPMTDEVRAILERQEQRFIETFGRSPGPQDPVFFDPYADEPRPINDEVLDTALLEAMHRAGVHPALIYAYQRTGRIVTAENIEHLTQDELEEWHAAVDEWYELHKEDKT